MTFLKKLATQKTRLFPLPKKAMPNNFKLFRLACNATFPIKRLWIATLTLAMTCTRNLSAVSLNLKPQTQYPNLALLLLFFLLFSCGNDSGSPDIEEDPIGVVSSSSSDISSSSIELSSSSNIDGAVSSSSSDVSSSSIELSSSSNIDGVVSSSSMDISSSSIEFSSSSNLSNPDSPTGVTATANSTSSVTVSWSSVAGATGYRIYFSATPSGTYTQVGVSTTTSYVNTGLTAGTTYYYKVAAYNIIGDGAQSNYASAITLPSIATDITATANSTSSITVSWSAVASAASYRIYRSATPSGTYAQVGISTTTEYTNASLTSGTAYYYKIAAYNSAGEGAQSSYVYATTQLNTPAGVTATANSMSSITVSWSSVTGAIGYRIYFSANPSGTYVQIGSSTATSYANTGLTAGATYYYKVAAYNSSGEGVQSNYASATTQLDIPANLTATANSISSITINWSAVASAANYRIYRSASAAGIYTQIDTSTTASYTNTGLTAGTTYYYKIAAYNDIGAGSQSSYISAITFPNAPTGVTTTANSTSSVTVSWPAVTGATGYRIYRSASDAGAYTQVGTSTTASYTNTGLTAGVTYYYKVAAYNSSGEGVQSDYVSVITFPVAPTGVTATANSTSSITVNWSAVTGATSYRIYRSATSSGTYTQVGTSTTTEYANTGLTAGATYYYKVSAYNSAGEGAQSGYASSTTLPVAPTGVTATASSTSSIIVNWSAVTSAANYRIYRSASAAGIYAQIGTSTSASYANTGLTAGATYYYKVSAYNSAGEGAQSSYASATTPTPTGTITDTRDGQTYEYVTIGAQTWMAENLNYNASGSCYDDLTSNCDIYGRLYDWATAMNISTTYNSSSYTASANHKGICPTGWHIPSNAEWTTLTDYVGGASTAGTKLKSASGWNIYSGVPFGTDDYGFSALPGGYRYDYNMSSNNAGQLGRWWSASEISSSHAYAHRMDYGNESVLRDYYGKTFLFSVRCVRD